MTFVRTRARILEISTTSGSGPFALAGAADGSYNTFASFMSVGDQTFVTVVEPGFAFWSGIATYSAANEITLTTVEETKGSFGAGTKEVMASPLASSSMLREDISGAIVTGGTSTAYTVASFRKYGSLAELDGNIIAFTPHVTNALGSPHVSLNVDGLGAKSLRADPTRELPPGVLIAGTPYTARYDNVNGLFLLHGVFGTPYNIPLGGGLDYWGATAPSSAFAFPVGQAISRAIYADLFALLGTTYGTGDGSTTFNLPDKRGRVSASADAMGGIAAGRLTDAVAGIDSPGDAGGAQSHTLSAGQIPSITSTNGSQGITVGTTGGLGMPAITGGWAGLGAGTGSFQTAQFNGAQSPQTISSLSGNNSISVTSSNTGGGAHNNVQPTIICNYIIRVL